MENRVMFYGPSGVGKTTMANYICDKYGIPFITGSISDLIPKTKGMTHVDMMDRDPKKIYLEDMQLLNLRSKNIKDHIYSHIEHPSYVTDRSYLDIMAYHLIKVSKSISECDTAVLFENVTAALARDCTHLIFVPFTEDMLHNWEIENNNKRVLNRYFQWHVSQVMYGILRLLDYKQNMLSKIKGINMGEIYPDKIYRHIDNIKRLNYNMPVKTLIINTSDFDKRNEQIDYFLNK